MKRYVIDRIESGLAILVDDDCAEHEVRTAKLPKGCRSEGAVLKVPKDAAGAPDWAKETRDREEEMRLLADGEERLKRLRRRDSGGDVTL